MTQEERKNTTKPLRENILWGNKEAERTRGGSATTKGQACFASESSRGKTEDFKKASEEVQPKNRILEQGRNRAEKKQTRGRRKGIDPRD